MVSRQKKSWMIFAIAGFACVSLFSKDIHFEDVRGSRVEPLRISSKKDSPAYAAFVFAGLKFTSKKAFEIPPGDSKKLASGTAFNVSLLTEAPPVIQLAEQNQMKAKQPPVQLKGMVVSSRETSSVAKYKAEPPKDWVKELKTTLPADQSRRLAQIEDWLKGQDWTASSNVKDWKQKAKAPIPTDRGEVRIATQSGGSIYVGNPELAEDTSKKTQARTLASHDIESGSSVERWSPPSTKADPNLRPLTLAGSLEMKDGLAFLGPQTSLVVIRELGGQVIERGKVWISEGKFEIFVREAKGYLVAELRDKEGRALGRGSLDLYKLPPAPEHKMRLDGIQLSVQPLTKGSQIAALSAHSFGGYKIAAKDSNIYSRAHDLELKKAENVHLTEDFIPGSTTLLEAQSEMGPTTVALSQLASDENIFLFDDSYIKALVEIVAPADISRINDKGFIIGRISDQGKAIAGAQVEIAGDLPAKAIYFNEAFIPDMSMTSTSSNGMFAAILLEPALYSVRAVTEGVYLPAKVLPTTAGQVTQAIFERRDLKSLAINLDAYPGEVSESKQATLSILGTETEQSFPMGSHIIQYHEGKGVFVLESSAGDFDPLVRMELPHGITSVDVPVISRSWIDGMAIKKRVNLDPYAGRALGFGPSESFEVIIDKGQGNETLIYLDQNGEPLYQDFGQPNGAFLIYNLKPGIHTISVLTKNGSKIFSRVIVSEYEVINVMSAPE